MNPEKASTCLGTIIRTAVLYQESRSDEAGDGDAGHVQELADMMLYIFTDGRQNKGIKHE